MGTIRSKLALSFAVAVAGLASFAGTAAASRSYHSVTSQYVSPVGGTCVADDFAAAGNTANGAPVWYYTDYYYYNNCFSGG
jgi:hypothetical protein